MVHSSIPLVRPLQLPTFMSLEGVCLVGTATEVKLGSLDVNIFTWLRIFSLSPLCPVTPHQACPLRLCHVSNFQSRAKAFPLEIVFSPDVFPLVPGFRFL